MAASMIDNNTKSRLHGNNPFGGKKGIQDQDRMVLSLSGLQPAKKNEKMSRTKKKNQQKLEFQSCIRPAPFAIKPFAALVNPFKSGCSIFCNHPTKNVGLKMAIEKTKRKKMDDEREAEIMGQILEDIICRYGAQSIETDTVATTPENEVLPPPRPHLVLNLRRTVSQETGRTSGGLQSTFSPSPSSQTGLPVKSDVSPLIPQEPPSDSKSELEEEEGGGDVIKRRGKIRKKKKKQQQTFEKGEKEVTDLIEPKDTLVSTCKGDGTEYESDDYETERPSTKCQSSRSSPPLLQSTLFDNKTLRHLRRSLSITQVESEFRKIWRRVLQEALTSTDSPPKEKVKIDEDLDIPECQTEKWLSYPRTFSRSSARFDLPINKRLLNDMKPLDYLRDYVANSKCNMLLYNHVFNKYKDDSCESHLMPEIIIEALGDVMGRPFTEEEGEAFKELIDLPDADKIDYRTWLGLCALSERFYGEKFSVGKDINLGKRPGIEQVDFESLEKRKSKLKLNPKIDRLLTIISTS